MITVDTLETTTDVSHDVKGEIDRTKYHVLVNVRNGVVKSVSFMDERLTRFITEKEKIRIIDHMKKKFEG